MMAACGSRIMYLQSVTYPLLRVGCWSLLLTAAACKWLEPTKSIDNSATVNGENFTLFDDSSALPTRERPHAKRSATVRVTLPAAAGTGYQIGVLLEVAATVERDNARIKFLLTQPDGSHHDGVKSVGSGLVICPSPPQPCDLSFDVVMTYDGLPGTDHVTWTATATTRHFAASGVDTMPPKPVAPTITTTLLPP